MGDMRFSYALFSLAITIAAFAMTAPTALADDKGGMSDPAHSYKVDFGNPPNENLAPTASNAKPEAGSDDDLAARIQFLDQLYLVYNNVCIPDQISLAKKVKKEMAVLQSKLLADLPAKARKFINTKEELTKDWKCEFNLPEHHYKVPISIYHMNPEHIKVECSGWKKQKDWDSYLQSLPADERCTVLKKAYLFSTTQMTLLSPIVDADTYEKHARASREVPIKKPEDISEQEKKDRLLASFQFRFFDLNSAPVNPFDEMQPFNFLSTANGYSAPSDKSSNHAGNQSDEQNLNSCQSAQEEARRRVAFMFGGTKPALGFAFGMCGRNTNAHFRDYRHFGKGSPEIPNEYFYPSPVMPPTAWGTFTPQEIDKMLNSVANFENRDIYNFICTGKCSKDDSVSPCCKK